MWNNMVMIGQVTCLLQQWQQGDSNALNELMPLVYSQLRAIAGNVMRSERAGHTLRPTAILHEAYLRMADGNAPLTDREHFFSLSAKVMRHILLDWARARSRGKRGGGAIQQTLHDDSAMTLEDPETIIEIDRLLDRLAAFDARKTSIVEMIFFAGMTYDETAGVLGISAVTVHRELKMAKSWMYAELTRTGDAKSG